MKTLLFNKGENMKVLVLSSGGDAPGMNKFVCQLYKSFKSDLYFAYAGFSGLIDGQIFAFKDVYSKDVEDKAGSVIHSSRCPEFKQKKYFAKTMLMTVFIASAFRLQSKKAFMQSKTLCQALKQWAMCACLKLWAESVTKSHL